MHLTDTAIILSLRKHGEHGSIVRAFTRHHGVYAGVVRGATGKNGRGVWQPGNEVLLTWKARLSEQLGSLTGELITPHAALAMATAAKLAALSSACALIEMSLPEREAHERLYEALMELLISSSSGLTRGSHASPGTEGDPRVRPEDDGWAKIYARFELALLTDTGFRLDLTHCAATGATEELIYVSPRSGRAVSRLAGEPYKDKLFALPELFFGLPPQGGGSEVGDALRVTGHFLEHWLLAPHGRKLPAARERFLSSIKQSLAHRPDDAYM